MPLARRSHRAQILQGPVYDYDSDYVINFDYHSNFDFDCSFIKMLVFTIVSNDKYLEYVERGRGTRTINGDSRLSRMADGKFDNI